MIHLATFTEIKYNCLTKILLINYASNCILKKQIRYLELRFKNRRCQSRNNVLNKYLASYSNISRISIIKGLHADKKMFY